MKIHNLPEYAYTYGYILFHDSRSGERWFYGAYPTLGAMCAVANELYAQGDYALAWCYGYEAVDA